MPTPPQTPSEMLDIVRKSGLVSRERLAAVVPDPAVLPAEPGRAMTQLVQKGVVTRFQAKQLLQGRHKGFFLGSYVILDQLGRGGMGAVYLAEHRELRRKVAIKVLVTARDDDQKLANERFLREARASAALDHPNIVRLFDVSRHNGVPYLVMEYVDGETLQQTLDRSGALPAAAAADVIAQAAAGLQHAHERGFVHRDVKPGNLIRDRSGAVKILDMGLARSCTNPDHKLTEKLDAGAVVGTADFISPEQALNGPEIDIRGDIYSLGASFFALMTGRPPFAGNTTQKLLHHQMCPAPDPCAVDPTVPRGLAAIVAKMLAKRPADRYQTPAEVIAALSPWLGNSVRVMAGLSHTRLAAGTATHASLHDMASGTTPDRLGVTPFPGDGMGSDVFGPSDGTLDTRALASSETARSPHPDAARPAVAPAGGPLTTAGRRPAVWLFAAGGLAMLAVGLLVGWLAFGR